ncbi:PREDICTED: uncharacterized protein LOC107069021 [Polistes dominula]|uniref:Uncharacterized protein LOC107069021 n=1 Tax=Polistes dominula TaxID=743375 RepID=A0ABM1IMI2_POLDO|nr:PREDICTED: uncharacterized protein LOC107069021 [Polistes dominula]
MLHFRIIILIIAFLGTSYCYPIEEPTKFLLNTNKDSNVENLQKPASKLEQAQITSANDVSRISNENSKYLDQGTEFLDSLRYPPSIFFASSNNNKSNRETVHLENESEQSLAEKTLTLPFNDLLINWLKPKPLVDQIKEEDKYGNTGEKMATIGRALVNGFESFSNFLNSALINTKNTFSKTVGNNVIDSLNQLGGKLVGLQ